MNPSPPLDYSYGHRIAHIFLRNYEEAVSVFKKAPSISPKNLHARVVLIVIYVEMGRLGEARAEAREFLMIDPKWDSKRWLKTGPWKDPQYLERWGEAFRKVGLLEDEVRGQ
jgi:tetratricopeptide (TPR) repeat protein